MADLYLILSISSSLGPVVMLNSVRSQASRMSQYSLLLSSQSILPYLKVKKATALNTSSLFSKELTL